jgi:hypothetical protein
MDTDYQRHAHQRFGSIMSKVLDKVGTITLSTRAAVAGSSRRTLYTGVLCLAMLNPSSAQASQSIDYLKLYAHSRIVSEIQYNCFNKLITKESIGVLMQSIQMENTLVLDKCEIQSIATLMGIG